MVRKKKTSKRPLKIIFPVVALFIFLIFLFFQFIDLKTPVLLNPPLKELASQKNLQLGVHIVVNRLKNKPYRDIALSQFSFVTIDGPAQWLYLRPSVSTYNYSGIDKVINFAKQNNMPVQIHHLVWGETNYLPSWLTKGNFTPDQLLNILKSDITTTVSHYKGQVQTWTVVNEAFTRSEHIYGLHDWWEDHIGQGTTYIDDSFIWAHQADSNAKLILNDFDNESINNVSNAEYQYVKGALKRGIPIDGIGMQMHIDATNPPNTDSVIANMQRFKALGLPTYVTEFDVNVSKVKGNQALKDSLEAYITSNMVGAVLKSESCVSFDEFGITDKNNLIKNILKTNSHSFLFNNRYQAKPSYYSFRNALIEN